MPFFMLLFSLNFCLVFDPALPISLIRTPPCALLITAQDAKHYGLMTHYFCQVSIASFGNEFLFVFCF